MVRATRRRRNGLSYVLIAVGLVACSATSVLAFQPQRPIPATHERQCVPTGQVPPGDARTITVTWKHPFATGDYGVVGSVSEPGDSLQAIELSHIVIPHTPTTTQAIVLNRNASAPQAGIVCLDASTEE